MPYEVRWEDQKAPGYQIIQKKTSQPYFSKEVSPNVRDLNHQKQQSMCNLLYKGHSTMPMQKRNENPESLSSLV